VSLLEEIGAILGFVAFGGLAILAFLTFQQARHLRRLRDWAGREPERAAAEEERVAAAAEEATVVRRGGGEEAARGADDAEAGPTRIDKLRGEASVRMEEINRRSPVDPKILAGGLLAVLIGVAVATSGFGLFGGDDGGSTSSSSSASDEPKKIEVAVLNGTAPEEGAPAVDGVANRASRLIRDAELYKVGAVETAPGSFPASVVMFEEGSKSEATELAADLEEALGETEVELMTPEIEDLADGAPVALVVGVDDAGIA
jgi:hypothetical protein